MIDLFSVVQLPLIINEKKCANDLSSHESTILLGAAADRAPPEALATKGIAYILWWNGIEVWNHINTGVGLSISPDWKTFFSPGFLIGIVNSGLMGFRDQD